MHHDPYRDLAAVYGHLTRRPPDWTHHPAFSRYDDLDGIVAAVRHDHPDPTDSDTAVRTLIGLSRHDTRAGTVLLHALADELRARLARSVTHEYRADALGELAALILEGDPTGTRLGHRYVNRAHNRVHKHHRRVRHHGRVDPLTVDPYPTDLVTDLYDRQATPRDVADVVAARVDLERFGVAVRSAIADGALTEQTWETFADHRLSVVYLPDREPVPTRRRVAAYRAAKKLQPFIDAHLHGHAA